MAFLDFYLHAAHSLNTHLRKNEPDLVDVRFPSEVFYPKKDLLILLVDNDEGFLGDMERLLNEFLKNTAVKFRKVGDKIACFDQLKNNPDLIIIGDPHDHTCLELNHLINETNPNQRVICIGTHQDNSNIEQHPFGLKSMLKEDSTSFGVLSNLVQSHIK
jgi:hypothetical protein